MAVRARIELKVAFSSSAIDENGDLGKLTPTIVNDAQNEGGTWQTILLPGAIDVPLQLTGVTTGRLLVIQTSPVDTTLPSSSIAIKKNVNTGEPWVIQPLSGNKEGVFLISTDSLTALFGSNPGTSAMKVKIGFAGDLLTELPVACSLGTRCSPPSPTPRAPPSTGSISSPRAWARRRSSRPAASASSRSPSPSATSASWPTAAPSSSRCTRATSATGT